VRTNQYFFQHSIGDIRLEELRTIINGDLLLEKTLTTKEIRSFNSSLQIISGDSLQLECRQNDDEKRHSALLLGTFLKSPIFQNCP
jgi:hypothetical protein